MTLRDLSYFTVIGEDNPESLARNQKENIYSRQRELVLLPGTRKQLFTEVAILEQYYSPTVENILDYLVKRAHAVFSQIKSSCSEIVVSSPVDYLLAAGNLPADSIASLAERDKATEKYLRTQLLESLGERALLWGPNHPVHILRIHTGYLPSRQYFPSDITQEAEIVENLMYQCSRLDGFGISGRIELRNYEQPDQLDSINWSSLEVLVANGVRLSSTILVSGKVDDLLLSGIYFGILEEEFCHGRKSFYSLPDVTQEILENSAVTALQLHLSREKQFADFYDAVGFSSSLAGRMEHPDEKEKVQKVD